MSGATVAAILSGAGGQNPILTNLTLSNNTPCAESHVEIRFYRDGTVGHTFGCLTEVKHPPMWGGSTPRSTEGDAYQVRATVLSGSVDNEFDPPNVWLALGPASPRIWTSPLGFSGSSGSLVIKFEIRRLATSVLVATGTFSFTWVGV